MDVLRFIRSKDVRSYLREINYEFSPLETAFLIDRRRNISRKTKLAAWQELIDTTADFPMTDEGRDRYVCGSFHEFLREYMALQGRKPGTLSEHETDVRIGLEQMWFDIPVPFKRGDIVINRRWKGERIEVLDNIITWDSARLLLEGFCIADPDVVGANKLIRRLKQDGDYTDMGYGGYLVCDDCAVRIMYDDSYLDLEYYTEPLTGVNRLLYVVQDALRRTLTEGVDIERIVNLSNFIIEEEMGQYTEDYMCDRLRSDVQKFGLRGGVK